MPFAPSDDTLAGALSAASRDAVPLAPDAGTLRALLDSVAAVRCIDHRLVWANDEFASLLGYRREELARRTPESLVAQARDAGRLFHLARAAMLRGHPYHAQVSLRLADGRVRAFAFTCVAPDPSRYDVVALLQELRHSAPLDGAQADGPGAGDVARQMAAAGGRPWDLAECMPAWSGRDTVHGMGQRLREEEALASEHARMQGIFTAMAEGVVVMNAQGLIEDANPSALAILGVDRRQLLSQSLADDAWPAVRPDGSRMPWAEFPLHRALRTLRQQRQQVVGVRHPARGLRWLVMNAAPVDTDQPQRGVVATFTDITERLEVDQALAASQQELREAQRIAGIGTWRWDQRTGWHLWSPEIYDMFGRDTSQPPLGYPEVLEHLAPESAGRLERAVEACRSDHQPCQVDAQILRPDGSSRWVVMFGHPAPDITGRITQILWMVQDITGRKQLEQQLHQLAYFDPLTGLPNRRMLADRLRQAMAQGRRHSAIGAVLYLDLDRFKPLNDRHGHDVGDLLLAECAKRLLSGVREIDTVARLGGDEFVVVLPELEAEWQAAMAAAEAVRTRLVQMLGEPYRLPVHARQGEPLAIDYACPASIGMALFTGHEDDQDEILAHADLRMYEVKAQRRGPHPPGAQADLQR